MDSLHPETPAELAAALADAASRGRSIRLGGNFTKDALSRPTEGEVTISTKALKKVLSYEPSDLTISVESGLPYAELRRILAGHRQMVPLDPPFADTATVGGVVAANHSGPRRRLYGSARDLVIGMTYATLEGKLIQSGGMVVKNVAGLDTGKLMIGSFGTLAAMAVINFKLTPIPAVSRTYVLRFANLQAALSRRDAILKSVLAPVAIDLITPGAASRIGLEGFSLLVQASGNTAVMARYSQDFSSAQVFEGDAEEPLWQKVREYTPAFVAREPQGAIARVSSTLNQVGDILDAAPGEAISRAGSGVTYIYLAGPEAAARWTRDAQAGGWKYALEYSTGDLERWPNPGTDFAIMIKVKELFDPQRLLNRGRLYGRI